MKAVKNQAFPISQITEDIDQIFSVVQDDSASREERTTASEELSLLAGAFHLKERNVLRKPVIFRKAAPSSFLDGAFYYFSRFLALTPKPV